MPRQVPEKDDPRSSPLSEPSTPPPPTPFPQPLGDSSPSQRREITVWVVEDDPSYRAALDVLLERAPGIRSGGAFADGIAALTALEGADKGGIPDVLLLDFNLPGLDGIAVASAVRSRWPDVQIVMLTIRDASNDMEAALEAGASGYVLKHAPADALLRAIAEVHRGGLLVPPALRERVRLKLRHEPVQAKVPDEEALRARFGLTPQEARVALLLAERLTNAEIAERLYISPHTARRHTEHVLLKLNVHDRRDVADVLLSG